MNEVVISKEDAEVIRDVLIHADEYKEEFGFDEEKIARVMSLMNFMINGEYDD